MLAKIRNWIVGLVLLFAAVWAWNDFHQFNGCRKAGGEIGECRRFADGEANPAPPLHSSRRTTF